MITFGQFLASILLAVLVELVFNRGKLSFQGFFMGFLWWHPLPIRDQRHDVKMSAAGLCRSGAITEIMVSQFGYHYGLEVH